MRPLFRGAQGTVLWRARVPAESMAGLLQGGVIERSWIGGRMFGNAWLVNSKTGEGAWVGATHKVVSFVTPCCRCLLHALQPNVPLCSWHAPRQQTQPAACMWCISRAPQPLPTQALLPATSRGGCHGQWRLGMWLHRTYPTSLCSSLLPQAPVQEPGDWMKLYSALNPRSCCLSQTKLEEMGVDFKSKPGERTGMQVLPIGPTAHQVCMQHTLMGSVRLCHLWALAGRPFGRSGCSPAACTPCTLPSN